MPDNIFTNELLDVIIYGPDQSSLTSSYGIFIVLKFIDHDLNKILHHNETSVNFTESQAIILLY